MNLLGGASVQRLEGAIHASSMRQSVLSNNIANVDTPNFKRSNVEFEDLLSQAMGDGGETSPTLVGLTSDPRHIAINGNGTQVSPQVTTDETTLINNSKNNVDIDREMSLLAENQLRYNLYIQQINHNVKMLRTGMGK